MLTLLIHLVLLLSILIGLVIDPLNSVSNVYPARGVGRFFGAKLYLNTQKYQKHCLLPVPAGRTTRTHFRQKRLYTCIFLAFAHALLADAIHKWKRIVSSLRALSRFISEYG
jgi:hypothetical protein